MDHETIAQYCEGRPACTTEAPFGPQTVVYKVGGKMFALLSLDTPRLNVKCDPERAEELRAAHSAVQPGYHMSKKHWNSVYWEEEILDPELVNDWIDHSYELVVGSLSKTQRQALNL